MDNNQKDSQRIRIKLTRVRAALDELSQSPIGRGVKKVITGVGIFGVLGSAPVMANTVNNTPTGDNFSNTPTETPKKINNYPNILCSNQLEEDSLIINDSLIMLKELPTENINTYNIVGLSFTNDDFEGCTGNEIIKKIIKKCLKTKKNYGQSGCTAAIKREIVPLMGMTPEGHKIFDGAIKGWHFDEAVMKGYVPGWVSITTPGQDETFSNIDGYISCQYPKNDTVAANHGHIGWRYIANGTQYEYRGCMDEGGNKLVKKSGRKSNPYDNKKRKVITRIEYAKYAINKMLERGEELFFIYNTQNNIIKIYTPETLPQELAKSIAQAQLQIFTPGNMLLARGYKTKDEHNQSTFQVTSFELASAKDTKSVPHVNFTVEDTNIPRAPEDPTTINSSTKPKDSPNNPGVGNGLPQQSPMLRRRPDSKEYS